MSKALTLLVSGVLAAACAPRGGDVEYPSAQPAARQPAPQTADNRVPSPPATPADPTDDPNAERIAPDAGDPLSPQQQPPMANPRPPQQVPPMLPEEPGTTDDTTQPERAPDL